MQPIIAPVEKALLRAELNAERFVRKANFGINEIYILNAHNSPNVLREIGRLREIAFRGAGGGTGKELDLDDFDTCEHCYEQLIVWDPEQEAIVGGYRFIKCDQSVNEKGEVELATAELFHFSPKFIQEYLPYTIELGRSFVQPEYQPSAGNRKGLFSLDNLWDGLGALVIDNPEIQHFFGKITMYPTFHAQSRDLIHYFMNHYFPDKERLVYPIESLGYKTDISAFEGMFDGLDYKEGHKELNQFVRKNGENIPPLVNAYMNLSLTMKNFGTAINHHFGEVEETGILVSIADIYESKKERHVASYTPKA
ncbi:MAG: GNAT family N-acetyltransferase [Bacteroidota bacterium]|nr:GNAT family N-acetyltransferase [Bacteroidota bacterium]MDX5430469.1 GNAT family N-acetyltransferase [Bacteroidota bacterium]MDX5469230.1 GNAT family N-acetyltransferase [Bacteroidota bacterium]